MDNIKHFVLPENTNRLYEEEAISSIGLTREVADKINELVDAYNEFSQVDLEWKQTQEGIIRKGVLYIKDNLVNTLHDLVILLRKQGFYHDVIKEYTENLEKRLDNQLTALTVDGEVVDIRYGADGETYASAGEAVRTQFNDIMYLLELIKSELMGIPILYQTGYYRADGTVYPATQGGVPVMHSKYTELIPCSEGDVFYYRGFGQDEAVSAVYYDENKVVCGSDCFQSKDQFTEVTVPSPAHFVRFSSYSRVESDPVLEVVGGRSVHGQEIRALQEETEANTATLSRHDMTVMGLNIHFEVGYHHINGRYSDGIENDVPVMHSKYTDLINCVPGDVFLYMGVGSGNAGSVFFYDGKKSQIGYEIHNSKTAYTPVTIPEGCSYVRFSSYSRVASEPVLDVLDGSSRLAMELMELKGNVSGNVLGGKKYVACGDSFTAYCDEQFPSGHLFAGSNKVYPFFIGARNGMNVVNLAKGGATITRVSESTDPMFAVDVYKTIPADADYLTLKFGINDKAYGVPVGTIDDTTDTTFYGAWNIVMEYIVTNLPYCKVGIIISNGITGGNAEEFAEATRNIARKWGVPYLDETGDENVSLLHRTLRDDVVCATARNARMSAFRISNSDSHPNAKAHEFESTIVEDFLRRL